MNVTLLLPKIYLYIYVDLDSTYLRTSGMASGVMTFGGLASHMCSYGSLPHDGDTLQLSPLTTAFAASDAAAATPVSFTAPSSAASVTFCSNYLFHC